MFQQTFVRRLVGKHPIIQLECKEMRSETFLEMLLLATFYQNFLGGKVIQQLIHIINRSFCGHKLTGRYIQQSNTTLHLVEMDSRQKIVFFVV